MSHSITRCEYIVTFKQIFITWFYIPLDEVNITIFKYNFHANFNIYFNFLFWNKTEIFYAFVCYFVTEQTVHY